MGLFRRLSNEPGDPVSRLDLSALPLRLAPVVADAVDANTRWRDVVDSMGDGPIGERLSKIGERIERGVVDMHATALRVGDVERVLEAVAADRAIADYKRAKRAASGGAEPPELGALRERFESAQRLLNIVADAEERLRIVDARLAAAVARGAEVALTASEPGLSEMDGDLGHVLDELTALRAGLDAVK